MLQLFDLFQIALTLNDFGCHGEFFETFHSRNGIHKGHHGIFENTAQTSCAGFFFDSQFRNCMQCIVGKIEIDVIDFECFLILLDECVPGLGEYLNQGIFVERMKCRNDGQTAYKFWNHAEFEQIFGLKRTVQRFDIAFFFCLNIGVKADRRRARARFNDIFKADKCAAADEQNIGRIDAQKLLLRVFAAAFGRHCGDRTFDNL